MLEHPSRGYTAPDCIFCWIVLPSQLSWLYAHELSNYELVMLCDEHYLAVTNLKRVPEPDEPPDHQ